MFKNLAGQKIALFAFTLATGAGKTGDAANLTACVSKDFGAVTVLGDITATQMDATNAPGWYLFDLTQAETNADALLFTGKSSTSGVSVVGRPVDTLPSGISTLDAAGVRTAVGLAAANLDTQLTAIDDYIDTEVAAIKAKTDLIPAAPAAVSDIPTAIQNADTLLNRDMSTGTDSGSASVRTVRQALRFLRNKWTLTGTALSVKKEDDATESWASVVTTSAGADPISGSDPA